MGTSNATVTATNSRSNINQTITFRTSGGASAITLNGTSRTNGQTMSIACGTYNLSGSFSSGYGFSSWSATAGRIGSTSTLSTTYRVTGPATITLTGKQLVNYLDDVTYMQDLTAAQCSGSSDGATATLRDRRDNNTYTIAKINGNCWMTQNLRLAGGTTLTSTYSNVSSSYTIPTTDLTTGDNSYTQGEIHNSGNTTTGYWYNFCAASAGTNCSSSNSSNTTYDICPKGWRLPTNSEFGTITGTSYISAFSPVTGGYYGNGSLRTTSSGYWWSSTAYNSNSQYYLYYNGSSLYTSYNFYKNRGFYVRCIRSS